MWLVNTQTFEIELFSDPVDKSYAILSHTWTDDEVTFEDMKDLSIAKTKTGFIKIEASSKLAICDGLRYIWVDTCCIDKSSSAELSEAINSMFRWYKNAVVCYAFLNDLPSKWQIGVSDELRKCRWFTRGWTLQELIAPANLLFVDEQWNIRGTKMEFAEELQSITGVDRSILQDSTGLERIPIVKRMFWAAERQTTRVEDLAYCLMGIFDVNMPMIYGEGSKSFARLQEEILKKTSDLSLFAWQANINKGCCSILAESPSRFLASGSGEIFSISGQYRFRDEISMTNKGVKINMGLQYYGDGIYVMNLYCYRREANSSATQMGIYLKRSLDTYFRYSPHQIAVVEIWPVGLPKPIYLASTLNEHMRRLMGNDGTRRIHIDFPRSGVLPTVHDIKAVPETYWDADERGFSLHDHSQFQCFVRFRVTPRNSTNDLDYLTYSEDGSQNDPDYMTSSEDGSQIILFCDLLRTGNFQVGLFTETCLPDSCKLGDFIDPFQSIEKYGPLGDPFSLHRLSVEVREKREISISHLNRRYKVTATVAKSQSAQFRVTVIMKSQNDRRERL